MKKYITASLLALTLAASPASAQLDGFATGPVFENFGPTAKVETNVEIPKDTIFKIAFDIKDKAKPEKLNRSFESVARFINMHVAAGVPIENIKLVVVVHGGAAIDLTRDTVYKAHHEGPSNPSAAAIAKMQDQGVEFHLCGQSAAAYKIKNADLLPGVKMSLSAMTSHALLQQQGYTLNPF
ncbi:MAG: DsrE family protein [Parasphingorhabdus sp.]